MKPSPRAEGRLLIVASVLLAAAGHGAAERNAIFNGDFLDGKAGWTIAGPRDLEVVAEQRMVAHRADAMLVVRHGNLEQGFTIFSPYPIGVKPGQTYTLSLTIAGEGDVAFGVYEYGPGDKNTTFPLSDRLDLKPEPQTFTFTYRASEQAAIIRPRLVFFGRASANTGADSAPGRGGGSGRLNVRIMSFRLPLSEAEFRAGTHWPEWAVSGALRKYQGLSAAERGRIRAAVKVTGVLPPYEPLRRDGPRGFRLTTSQVSFAAAALPDRISILGRPALAEPMALTLQDTVGKTLVENWAEPLVARANEQEAIVRQTVRGRDCRLALQSKLTYDGLLICDLRLTASRAVRVGRASLSIPLRADVARLIRYNQEFTDGDYCFGLGPIPQPGETVQTKLTIGRTPKKNDWSPRRLGGATGTFWEWNRGVPHYFWIGDEARGLGWITEGEQGWSNAPGDVTWTLERSPGSVIARMNFITQPTTVEHDWTLRFILQVMPPKPVRADWFKLRFNRFWNWQPGDAKLLERLAARRQETPPAPQPASDVPAVRRYAQAGAGTGELRPPWDSLTGRGLPDIGFLWWDVWSVGCGSPQVAKPEALRAYLRAGGDIGHMALPYFAPTHLAIGDLNGYYYAAKTLDWAKLPQTGNTALYVKICPNSFASEYQACEIGRLIDEYGIEGVYFDNTHPEACANPAHGCGWTDAQGVRHPTIPYLGMRRLFMMVRQQFVARGKTPFIMKHAGAFPAEVSFADAQLDGEGTYGFDHTEMFTPSEFRAEYLGPNQFGVVQVYLPQFGVGVPTTEVSAAQQITIGTRRLLALAFIHGTPVYCGNLNFAWMAKAWGVLDELQGPTVDFVGYWDWPANDALNRQSVYASLYRQPERAVLAVGNLSAQAAVVRIPRAELVRLFPRLQQAADHMDRWPVKLTPENLELSVPAKDFRLISLQ